MLAYIEIEETDKNFFNERIQFLSEEENLKIYEKINYFMEKYKQVYTNNITYLYSLYLSEYLLLKDPCLISIYIALETKDELFIADANGNLIQYDHEFKTRYEAELMGYFAFIMNLLENKAEDKVFDDNSTSIDSSSNIPKTSLKPFNRECILSQETCEVDWGEKKITKKDLKKRNDYILNRIKIANQELRDELEGEIVRGNFRKKERTIGFNLPIDFETVITSIKKKLYKN
jgi:hypothetical protein